MKNSLLVKGTRDIGGNSLARGRGGGSTQYQLLFLAERKLRREELFWLTVTGAPVSSGKHRCRSLLWLGLLHTVERQRTDRK